MKDLLAVATQLLCHFNIFALVMSSFFPCNLKSLR